MLLARLPLTDVLASVSPLEDTVALALIVNEVAFVALAIFPGQDALPVHFVFGPVSFVRFTIRPVVVTEATDLVLRELSS